MDARQKIEAMPPLPEPDILKQPDDGELVDRNGDMLTPYFWAWMSHGYDTGMEPYFSADQVHTYARDYAAQTLASKEAELVRLRGALKEGRRAIGDHFAPDDCYATGPMTGDQIRDLVECPACSFIALFDALTQPPKEPT